MNARTSLGRDVRRLFALAWDRRPGQLALVLILMLLGGLFEFATIATIVPFLALLTDPGAGPSLPYLGPVLGWAGSALGAPPLVAAAAIFGIATLLTGILRLALAWTIQNFAFSLGSDISIDIQRRLLDQPYAYHISRNSSDILASLEKVSFLAVVVLQIMHAAIAAVMALFMVAALIWVDPLTAIVCAAAVGGIYGLVSLTIRRRLAHNSAVSSDALGRRIQITQESLGGIRDIIVDGSQRTYVSLFEQIDRRLARARASNAFATAAPRFIVETIGMVLIAGLAVLLMDGQQSVGGALPVLGAFALGAQRLLPLVQQFYNGIATARGNQDVLRDLLELLALPLGASNGPAADPLPFDREIAIEGVGFSYPARATPALDQVDLVIPRGATVGVVGETGSGKSTLLDLLMGLIAPERGHIAIDGVALDEATRRRWWRSIGHVPQSVFLADASIARNIAFGLPQDEIDVHLVTDAARRAQLHDFVLSLPAGYDTMVGERGIRLSGGQRQRLGIARALYKSAAVLILDEATNALDEDTEAAVLAALHAPGGTAVTTILVTHRVSSLAACDLVARLEHGRIAAVGSFEEVVGTRPEGRKRTRAG